jgi:preprotein translocase subunit SecG
MAILTTLLYILFVLSAFVLIVVILLQEGKGGGFGQMLGEGGQQTFGVGAKGINTFTGYTAGVFLVSALVLHSLNRSAVETSALDSLESIEALQPPISPGAAPPAAPPRDN